LRDRHLRAFLKVEDVRHDLHVLSSPELSAAKLQLHTAGAVPRVPEVSARLRVQPAGAVARSATPSNKSANWACIALSAVRIEAPPHLGTRRYHRHR
jgi:hypothetical protein